MNAHDPIWLWLIGLAASLGAIHLAAAWRDSPPDSAEFDRPFERTLIAAFAWAAFALIAIFAVTLSGLVFPPLAAALLWVAYAALRRRADLSRLYRLALPLAVLSFGCVVLLFQAVFGDSDFGLFSVFPPD